MTALKNAVPRRANGHPVADNAIRLLFPTTGWQQPRDLVKNAQTLKLMAKHGPLSPKEPCQRLCPRLRTAEDYAVAEKRITDPTSFAFALAFLPDDWNEPKTSIGAAALALMEAEHLPQGDGRKAELVNHAIQVWESEAGQAAIYEACADATRLLGTAPNYQELPHRVGEALCRIAEGVISDFGDTVEPSEIELLNTLDACQRIPEPKGAIAAGDAIVAKQVSQVDAYLERAYQAIHDGRLGPEGAWDEVELQDLFKHAQDAGAALTLLESRPSLLRKLPLDRKTHVATVSASIAYDLGWHKWRWNDAAALVRNLNVDDIDPTLDAQTRGLFQACCVAAPLLVLATNGNDVSTQFAQLRRSSANIPGVLFRFEARARELVERATSPPPQYSAGAAAASRSQAQNQGNPWAWILGAAGIVVIIIAANLPNPSSQSPSTGSSGSTYQPALSGGSTYRVPKGYSSELSADRARLEAQRQVSQAKDTEVDALGTQIERDRVALNNYNQAEVDEFNRKVSRYNRLIQEARAANDAYNLAVNAYNAKLKLYGH